jgi:hypothetical protein
MRMSRFVVAISFALVLIGCDKQVPRKSQDRSLLVPGRWPTQSCACTPQRDIAKVTTWKLSRMQMGRFVSRLSRLAAALALSHKQSQSARNMRAVEAGVVYRYRWWRPSNHSDL